MRMAALLAFAAVALAAGRPGIGQRSAPRADFTVTAGDYSLHLPPTVPAGWRTVRFRNSGREFHHAVFLRVRDARAADSALAVLATWREDWDRPVAGTRSIGGVEGSLILTGTEARPGEDTYATLDLQPGLYLVVCMIPSGGVLHVNRGMHALLRVTPPRARDGGASSPPTPDATLRASDYSYRLAPRGLAPGWRLVEVTGAGPAEHVAEFARLRPGRTLADVLAPPRRAAGGADDDPEAAVVGGTTRLAAGARAFVWLHLSRGTYVVQCPLHTPAHQSHVRRGMVAELQVR